MKTDNFIAFFTVCGFFMGLVFVILKATDPTELVLYTLLITLFFYLMVHIVIMNYVDANKIGEKYFNKEEYEDVNNYLIDELGLREKRIESIISTPLDPKTILKKQSKKHERVKAKAA
ncbi:hypothetical protein [Campylobacter hyointestinalis]|uniref:Motility integral membrane protein n=3 Tax=Campylobacter hyointestinalis TaxID=198 RepID=A0AAV6ECV5_CAMHY|nr:hypothetical protein [Campylobacter hyointestinalis]ANE33596.1 putative membrane protein [Campylobacter hyointestinalis subsp. lawsonii CCUG 27631]KAB0611408.1 hypothetical protein F7P66_08655 [Campylobacter hyointestinalis subsp. lawsonii]QKF68784.1 putative membrane protein [Campylobacter hyointestinalis subsp. lawsonii]RAZ27982.1 hypothetical protein CHLT_06170 [Campylobacter hyointestinalis subsp. lawsonii]RAZ46477.1 hypothetical protein CHL14416_05365 [Campylobacter hyointestinalis sub